jgi:transcriptional regulator with XRE-family HTH domain
MSMEETPAFGTYLKEARLEAGLTQSRLARAAGVQRLSIVRIEAGTLVPRLDETVRLAAALKLPIHRLASGRWRPGSDLRGLAFELFRLGIWDLEVAGALVPGAFRRREQIVAAALKGDRPEPRIVEAMPAVLARHKFDVPLLIAFAHHYDPRIRRRLAWLSDITRTLCELRSFPLEIRSEPQLSKLMQSVKIGEPDSLGHPGEGNASPIWRRWKITYAGSLATFKSRIRELVAAGRRLQIRPGDAE